MNPRCSCCLDDDWRACEIGCRFYCERCSTYKFKETEWAFYDEGGDCCLACVVAAAVKEIAENWNSAPVAGEDAEEFYNGLHDPNTDARELLEGQLLDPIALTDEQWREALDRLRVLFPRPGQV